MPWTANDADKHKNGLSQDQKEKWASIANAVLAQCKKEGGKDCEGKAIRIANDKCDKSIGGVSMGKLKKKITESKTTEIFDDDAEIEREYKSIEVVRFIPFACKNLEKREVTGIVLEPEKVDLQGDIYDAETIERSCNKFNDEVRRMGVMHKQFNGDFKPLQSYIVDVDEGFITIGGNKCFNGTWILRAKAMNDETWEAVKNGQLTGWSIGYRAKAIPLDIAA